MSIAMLILVTLLAVGVILLLRAPHYARTPANLPPPHDAAGPDSARRILDERFAKGEISEDEYRQRRDVLSGH